MTILGTVLKHKRDPASFPKGPFVWLILTQEVPASLFVGLQAYLCSSSAVWQTLPWEYLNWDAKLRRHNYKTSIKA